MLPVVEGVSNRSVVKECVMSHILAPSFRTYKIEEDGGMC